MSIIGFEKKINFEENTVNVLEIYNQKLFSNFISCINGWRKKSKN